MNILIRKWWAKDIAVGYCGQVTKIMTLSTLRPADHVWLMTESFTSRPPECNDDYNNYESDREAGLEDRWVEVILVHRRHRCCGGSRLSQRVVDFSSRPSQTRFLIASTIVIPYWVITESPRLITPFVIEEPDWNRCCGRGFRRRSDAPTPNANIITTSVNEYLQIQAAGGPFWEWGCL